MTYNTLLLIGAALSTIASLLHVCIIFGGAPWYRFFGAGERIAKKAIAGSWYPPLLTTGIAVVLLVWAAYALSGGGTMPRLPLLKPMLCVITAIYLARGLVIFPVVALASKRATPFLLWSSAICLGYGLVHLAGVIEVWDNL